MPGNMYTLPHYFMRPSFMRIVAAAALLSLFGGIAHAADTDQLSTAVTSNDTTLAGKALEAGVDVNADLGRGRTALIVAAMMNKPVMVRFLLEHGADPNRRAEDPTIGNALSAAFVATNGVVLTRRGEEDYIAPKYNDALTVLRLLAARKPQFDVLLARGPTRLSPLMIAADAGALDAVRILLDNGASPNFANGGKYTALDYAADRAPGWSPASAEDRAEIVRLLLAAGAQPDHKGADGLTPADRARRSGNAAIVAALASR
jgi:ankyrin repeat protein